ncbi:hypothetical protein [Micromonospora sp. RV43]|uniref:hypothetical protein n=1 Tax=Micromonospora sp. RV43 TaxID=1661387 RepID=UPI00064BED2E|nr:hypothetical protein [Micromonospora sp. RV43]
MPDPGGDPAPCSDLADLLALLRWLDKPTTTEETRLMSNRRKLRDPLPSTFVARPPDQPATYWNGELTEAVRVHVVVADAPQFARYWARDLVGAERDAVRVTYYGQVFYLDDEDGSGWTKVTTGYGSPRCPHRELAVEREVLTR